MIHGHTHHPAVHQLAPGKTRWVLSDWDFESTPPRGDVLRLTRSPGTIDSSPVLQRLSALQVSA
jgi:hypothetical protein